MSKRKAQSGKNSTQIRNSILSAALDMAAHHPWEFVTIGQIAKAADLKISDVVSIFPSKINMLEAIIDKLDYDVEQSFQSIDDSLSIRDRLFDVLMERIDLADQHREAHISFFKSFGWTKESSCSDLMMMKSSMGRMAKCAGLETEGIFGSIKLLGLSIGYIWVLLTWMNDVSPDLGKTMAELDKTLGRIESLASYLNG